MTRSRADYKKSNVSYTRANYAILTALLTGKYIRPSISNELEKEISEKVGFSNVRETLVKFEENGLIEGYVPVLSEKGRNLLEALRLVYANQKVDEEVVGDVLKEVRL